MKKHSSYEVIEKVPVDYYQKGVKNNIFQKLWHTRKLLAVSNMIVNEPKEILDVGCASGWFLSQIAKKYPNANCYGIDIYKEGIEYAKRNYPTINFRVSNAEKIMYPNKKFDLVICTEVIEHLENPEMALNEINRVLKINGYAIIEVDSGSILFSFVWFLWQHLTGKVWEEAHLHSFNINKFSKLAYKTKFKIVKKKKFNIGMAMVFLLQS